MARGLGTLQCVSGDGVTDVGGAGQTGYEYTFNISDTTTASDILGEIDLTSSTSDTCTGLDSLGSIQIVASCPNEIVGASDSVATQTAESVRDEVDASDVTLQQAQMSAVDTTSALDGIGISASLSEVDVAGMTDLEYVGEWNATDIANIGELVTAKFEIGVTEQVDVFDSPQPTTEYGLRDVTDSTDGILSELQSNVTDAVPMFETLVSTLDLIRDDEVGIEEIVEMSKTQKYLMYVVDYMNYGDSTSIYPEFSRSDTSGALDYHGSALDASDEMSADDIVTIKPRFLVLDQGYVYDANLVPPSESAKDYFHAVDAINLVCSLGSTDIIAAGEKVGSTPRMNVLDSSFIYISDEGMQSMMAGPNPRDVVAGADSTAYTRKLAQYRYIIRLEDGMGFVVML